MFSALVFAFSTLNNRCSGRGAAFRILALLTTVGTRLLGVHGWCFPTCNDETSKLLGSSAGSDDIFLFDDECFLLLYASPSLRYGIASFRVSLCPWHGVAPVPHEQTTHRPLSSSFLGLPSRILNINHKFWDYLNYRILNINHKFWDDLIGF